MEDPYTILGITRNASDAEIKKAYKQKAMENHPDKGGDENEFKKINEAYNKIVSGETGQNVPFNVFNQGNFHDIFTHGFPFHPEMFNNMGIPTYDIKLDLESFFTGKRLSVNNNIVQIPPNIPINSIIEMRKENIRIRLKPKKHPMFSLDMYGNLVLIEHISLFEALTGYQKRIKLPNGKCIVIKTTSSVDANETFVVRNCGMPSPRNGNSQLTMLLVNLQVILPKRVNFNEHTDTLKQILNCNVPPISISDTDVVHILSETTG